MRNTELKNWAYRAGLAVDAVAERRLVWEVETASIPPETVVDAADRKLDKQETSKPVLEALTDRLKTLTLNNGEKIDIRPMQGREITALEFRTALVNAVGEDKSTFNNDLKVRNADQYLLNGLLEYIGSADKKPSQTDTNELTGLTAWLQKNSITSFSIKDGFWEFYKADKSQVSAEYALDEKGESVIPATAAPEAKAAPAKDASAKPPAKSPGSAKPSETLLGTPEKKNSLAKIAIGKDVAVKKTAEAVEKAKKETARLEVKTLENVSASTPVDLTSYKSFQDVLNMLALSLPRINGDDFPIKAAEMKVTLLKYIEVMPGKTHDERFTNFLGELFKKNPPLNQITVKDGKIVFQNKDNPGGTATPNPLGLTRINTDDPSKSSQRVIYVHEKLQVAEDEKIAAEKAAKEREKTAKIEGQKDKRTEFTGTETQVQALLKPPGSGEFVPTVDARYLPAFQQILAFNPQANKPVTFNIPFFDEGNVCNFYRDANGAFILRYGKGEKAYAIFTPEAGSKTPWEDAKKYYAQYLNSGTMLQDIQRFNVKDRETLSKKFLIPIDNGPHDVDSNTVEYELGWKTGLRKDPHIFVEVLPHGSIRVEVRKAGIGVDDSKDANNDQYTFVAGGFQDMARILHSLEKWHDNSEKDTPAEKSAEQVRRYFSQGVGFEANGERKAAGLIGQIPAECKPGKLLRVDSLPADVPRNPVSGYNFHFDWMEKQTPPMSVQMVKAGNEFEVKMSPSGMSLGRVSGKMPDGFQEAMRLVAGQREIIMTEGGLEKAKERVQGWIDNCNGYRSINKLPNVIMMSGIEIVGVAGDESPAGQKMVSLKRQGMEPVTFDFGYVENPKGTYIYAGIDEAVKQGYLLEGSAEAVAALKAGKGKGASTDRLAAGPAVTAKPGDKPAEKVDNPGSDISFV